MLLRKYRFRFLQQRLSLLPYTREGGFDLKNFFSLHQNPDCLKFLKSSNSFISVFELDFLRNDRFDFYHRILDGNLK